MHIGHHARIGETYEDYGCRVNAISTEELFARYRRAGFLYPAKLERLAPFWPEVSENWRKAARAGEMLLYWITYEGPRGEWASIACWRSTWRGWQSQHLVSLGSPQGSRAVMLAGQAVRIHDGVDSSFQNWFRPDNRLPARVFGGAVRAVGARAAALGRHALVACPLLRSQCGETLTIEEPEGPAEHAALRSLVLEVRGEAFLRAEELDGEDLRLAQVDSLYQLVGLRRHRRVWLAWQPGDPQPVAAAIANRGPLGLNFSFLENRCDLLMSPRLPESRIEAVARALVGEASGAYRDFAPGSIPLVTDPRTAVALDACGGRLLRHYCQSIWLREGFVPWYRHVEGIYSRLHHAAHRRGFGQSAREMHA